MKRDRTYRVTWILAVAIPLAIAPAAHAQYYWTGGSDNWTTTADWSPNGTPSSSDTVYIGNGGTVTVNSADACLIAYVGSDQSTGPGVGTLNITNSTFGAALAYIGAATNGGTVTQTGGSATISTVYFGGATSGWAGGTYNLNGGTLSTHSITFGTYGGDAFNLGGGVLQWGAGSTCSAPMTLTSSTSSTIDVQGNAVTMSGALTGGGSLTLGTGSTTGAVTFRSATSTYSGGTTFNAGVLRIAASSTGSAGSPTAGPVGTGSLVLNGGTIAAVARRPTNREHADALQCGYSGRQHDPRRRQRQRGPQADLLGPHYARPVGNADSKLPLDKLWG